MSFDHRNPGTPPQAWTPLLAAAPEIAPPGAGAHVVVVAAHPDDETLGAGGLIALAAACGAQITVIVASDGEASHPASPTHSAEDLAKLRRDEGRAAVAALDPQAEVIRLGLPDGRLAEHRREIADAVDAVEPPPTHLVTPWAGDRHPDHEACTQAVRCAGAGAARHVARWEYPIWAWHWARPDRGELPAAGLRRIRLDGLAREAKERALACYPSQLAALSGEPGDEPLLSEQVLAHFRRDVEAFYVCEPQEPAAAAYFDQLYERAPDPWGLADRFYEQRKRALLLAVLPRRRFRRAFEPGCATGLLTAELADRCTAVVAWDVAHAAVTQARSRLAPARNVSVERAAIPARWPGGAFDLIVLSEVGYYCTDLSLLAQRVRRSLAPDGVLVACHWRHATPLHRQQTPAVHAALGSGLTLLVDHVEDDFLLQVWTRSGRSVAAAEGIVP
ncbi:MAG TPA: PIG-L family deacetylase [Jatrophihabitans sp.]|nr:PIG-L family deacetylase [Jatrophihabitans sp.]